MSVTADHNILIVGAGFSGIGLSIALQQAGFDDHIILEEGDDVGGTWNWNRYPGVAVDIPSFSYQFSFERRTDWSRVYAPGTELRRYAGHCADKYDVRRRVRLRTRVTAAAFDEHAGVWRVQTDDGGEIRARFLLDGTGVLTQPKMPDIPGVDDFSGHTMHTARWDDGVDLADERVGIIGTGASAVQVIPEIAQDVASLTVFQRTPIWCLPKPDAAIPGWARAILGALPFSDLGPRWASQAFVEATFPLPAHFGGILPLGGAAERLGRWYLRNQVTDSDVREKLTPAYALGCKRPSFHNEYLATFNRANVLLETSPITRITKQGVSVRGGRHRLDVLIHATGFKVFEDGNMPPFAITGRGGADLASFWKQHRFQAYEGASVPGFPNYFLVLGPYAYNGASYFNLIETQARHIVRCLVRARELGANVIEVDRGANDRYFEEMLARRPRQIFFQPSCAHANSYYFDAHGDVPFRPSPSAEVDHRSRHFDLDNYHFTAA